MKEKNLKTYSIIITIVAALLLVAVIIFGINYAGSGHSGPAAADEENAQISAETAVQEKVQVSETQTPEVENAAAEESARAGSEGDAPEKDTDDEVLNNVGGVVGWEEGNNDSRNIINAWMNSLDQLDLDMDIAFIGDSIIERGDFRPYFPDKKIVNLGCGGDTIRGVYNRSEVLSYVHAEKIFIMCGVNMLRNDNVEFCRTEYGGLLNAVQEYAPGSEVYVCSILPMAQDWQDEYCSHETTEQFNRIIKSLAEKRGMTYVDLYSLFETAGVMNPEYTVDGVHLTRAGYDLWMQAISGYVYD